VRAVTGDIGRASPGHRASNRTRRPRSRSRARRRVERPANEHLAAFDPPSPCFEVKQRTERGALPKCTVRVAVGPPAPLAIAVSARGRSYERLAITREGFLHGSLAKRLGHVVNPPSQFRELGGPKGPAKPKRRSPGAAIGQSQDLSARHPSTGARAHEEPPTRSAARTAMVAILSSRPSPTGVPATRLTVIATASPRRDRAAQTSVAEVAERSRKSAGRRTDICCTPHGKSVAARSATDRDREAPRLSGARGAWVAGATAIPPTALAARHRLSRGGDDIASRSLEPRLRQGCHRYRAEVVRPPARECRTPQSHRDSRASDRDLPVTTSMLEHVLL
jgi:hypothetical protein